MNYSFLNVGVSDLDRACRLWRDLMGMVPAPWQHSDIANLESVWGVPAGTVRRSQILCTPGAPGGALHLVEFAKPARPIRDGAAKTDLCPKNLDVNVVDLPARLREIEQAGYRPLSAIAEYAIGDLEVREVQVPVEDGVNLVLAEIVGEPLTVTDRGFGGITSVVTTTGDIQAEVEFLSLLGFAKLDRHLLEGPAVEQMVGLPAGAKLEMQLLGDPTHRYGRAELVRYHGAQGEDLYSRCQPPALGLFRAALRVDDCTGTAARLRKAGYTVRFANPDRAQGNLVACSATSPAGWTVDLLQSGIGALSLEKK